MIKIFETNNTEYLQCNSCLVSNKDTDIFRIIVGKDYRQTTSIRLCRGCLRDLKEELHSLDINGKL